MEPLAKSIWVDGRFVPWADARLHVMAHTLHYGVGVFEGIRCYAQAKGAPAIFRLEEHVDRLRDSARCVGMELPFDRAALIAGCKAAVKENGLADCYLRPIAFHADGEPGLGAITPVSVSIIAFAWGAYLGKDGLEKGIRATLSSWVRHHVGSAMLRAKVSGQYTTSVLAKRLAKQNGFDEAIFCDADGYLCEGTGENLFVVRGKTLKTPPAHAAILPGITRDSILALARAAKELGLDVREEPIARDELFLADEAFFCGTAAEVTPIRDVDHRPIGDGRRGKVTAALQQKYFRAVHGEEPGFGQWLARVA
jgi:branched-chain amino acid aminotransferase